MRFFPTSNKNESATPMTAPGVLHTDLTYDDLVDQYHDRSAFIASMKNKNVSPTDTLYALRALDEFNDASLLADNKKTHHG
eukprot:9653479-Ditylum_brightwellii.AAC.1